MKAPLPALLYAILPLPLLALASLNLTTSILATDHAHVLLAISTNWIVCSFAGYAHECNLPLMKEFGFSVPVLGTLVTLGWIYSNTSLRNPLVLFALFFGTFFSSLAAGIRSALSTNRVLLESANRR